MQIDPTKRTHAQNRFLRRLQNKHNRIVAGSGIGLKGEPIPGVLTPTEIAHKARRQERRLQQAQDNILILPERLKTLETRLSTLESQLVPKDSAKRADHLTDLYSTRKDILNLKKEISRAQRIISALS